MIIDERTYTIVPGMLSAYLESHFRIALPLMRKYLGEPHGYFVTETGDLDQFVHWWRYDSMADREARRARMYADPAWNEYRSVTGASGWVQHQHNRLLRSVEIPKADY